VTRIRALALAVGWLVAALLFSLGAAGIATGIGGQPGTVERPELTSTGDDAIRPGLAAAAEDLQALADRVDALGNQARIALAALAGTDRDMLSNAADAGTEVMNGVSGQTDALRARLLALPGVAADAGDPLPPSTELILGRYVRDRFGLIYGALAAADDLPGEWIRFTTGSLSAQGLTTVLLDHDTSTADAARLGADARYADALTQLDQSDSLIALAKGARDRLANTVDVLTLTEWIDRNAAYDGALRDLYDALRRSKGKANDEVRDAYTAEQAARERLPADTRGVVVIMGEVARGGLNQAAIAIEDVRTQLEDAIAAVDAVATSP
jgi:hypothetical protein